MHPTTENKEGLFQIVKSFFGSLKPTPRITVSEWAQAKRILSTKISGEPGPWRNERTPYLVEIMDCLSDNHPCKEVVAKKASQVGFTEAAINWVGYTVDHAPCPMMLVWPRSEDAKRNSKLRVETLFEESHDLKAKVGEAKRADSSNTILQKSFPGGELVITGANSAAGLRSMPVKKLLLDEVDGYPFDLAGEGSPVELAKARTRTFARKKIFMLSTPTIKDKSRIDIEFERTDKRHYQVPCPECGKPQKLEFKNLRWPEGKPKEVAYECTHCKSLIEEYKKTDMLAAGKWVAEAESDVPGFFLNSLYSPVGWHSWADMAKDYEDALNEQRNTKNTEKMKSFYNTQLGESFEEMGEAPSLDRLYSNREEYKIGIVPAGACVLTCGVDVQKDYVQLEVVGWGPGLESWSIDYKSFSGKTDEAKVWDDLEIYLQTVFVSEDEKQFPIRFTCIDSGYNTQHVYNFCRKFPTTQVVPTKGAENLKMAAGIPRAVDVKINGKNFRRGVKVWNVGTSHLKEELYGFLNLEPPIEEKKFPKGYCHFPEYDAEFFKQLTAEKSISKKDRNGNLAQEWIKTRERNEALDTRILNRAATAILGLDRYNEDDWAVLRQKMSIALGAKRSQTLGNTAKKPIAKKRRVSDYW